VAKVYEIRHHKTGQYLGSFVLPAGFTLKEDTEMPLPSSWVVRDEQNRWFALFHEVSVSELPELRAAGT